MLVLGIDPGKTGGIALINTDLPTMLHGMRMPTMDVKSKYTLMPSAIKATFNEFNMDTRPVRIDAVVLENVHSMPAQGVASSFQFGRMFGAIESWAHANYPGKVTYAEPAKWKREMELTGQDKKGSVIKATRWFGDNGFWPLKSDDGIAEAALMGLWHARFNAKT